ncbi:hypothetical protein [Aneurinibacillus danicus]|uniref:Glycosyltransferase 2-like domain-containing protein n=1 Tax=Aneurinibacillus danicus TaxID=267746 RepID=A0A511VCS6_9BACL|nr:hypothetical protein [Aneurinibacillus danicus]GEN35032.1 hypothetical protein ADA01nite_24920 [Aneurinibacillus danicus]
MTMKKRVLIGSPVHQKPEILSEFLRSLKTLKVDTLEVDYAFVDDNANEESSRMLQEFYHRNSKVMIDNGIKQDEYAFHQWTDYLMEKVAVFKIE